MIFITSGSVNKAEIKNREVDISKEIKAIKDRYKKDKVKTLSKDDQKKIGALERKKAVYAKTLPVKIDDLIIDFKLYEKFMEKIYKFEITHSIGEKVKVSYKTEHGEGSLELEDLSPYFEGFEHIPLASVKENGS